MPERYVISGCSGGGKSTLIEALAREGCTVIPEPGRRIIRSGGPMPWDDPAGFARRAVDVALADWTASAAMTGPVFFDRGLIDAVEALRHADPKAPIAAECVRGRYRSLVFFAPPWPALFDTDAERRHDWRAAHAEYERLAQAYPAQGYRLVMLPKTSVADRVAFVRDHAAA